MERIVEFNTGTASPGMRIDAFLRAQGVSGSVLNILRRDMELVRLGGVPSRVVDRITTETTLSIRIPEEQEHTLLLPEALALDVLYEDADILLVNKPDGMAVYPTPANPSGTLANACLGRYGKEFVFRCLGRLDRHTSGLVLIAKNRLSACILTDALHTDGLARTYLAAVEGLCPVRGTIDAPIARDPGSILARRVSFDGDGVRAVTHYTRLDCRNGCSLVKIQLETGRTHQIRVHMRHIGHPLPGDFLYNPVYTRIARPALHAWQLDFLHPITRIPMHFTAPVPRDIMVLFD